MPVFDSKFNPLDSCFFIAAVKIFIHNVIESQ